MLSLLSVPCAALVQQVFSSLNSDCEEGSQTRLGLYKYAKAKGLKVCPLSVSYHPLEPALRSPLGEYWDLVRQTLTTMRLSIDDSEHMVQLEHAPWQTVLPFRDSDGRGTKLAHLRFLQQEWAQTLRQDWQPDGTVCALLHQADRICNHCSTRLALQAWLGKDDLWAITWGPWEPLQIMLLWTVQGAGRVTEIHERHMRHCMVSDGTQQRDGLLAFAGCESGAGGWVGRVHIPGTSYESEVVGLLENLDRLSQLPQLDGIRGGVWRVPDCFPVSDCRSALYLVRSALCQPHPGS